ncbi:hypothetical protein [Corynebacterium crudilactis]|uniref:Uncharacterized protein n=1 Tax=Corynebacterium crudilactis TaxID=1652495 RepID=A0A172QW51_9CORY|nr:hypothetical protein [Corynebacterium crudilactis]ANE04850.1 hypothetical protein ccrud_12020 [Corynebacterium crudilactis]
MAALLGLLIVIALIIWAVVALRGGSTEPEEEQPSNAAATSAMETTKAAETETSATSSSSEAPTSETTTAKETSSEEPTPSSSTAAEAKDSCELKDLIISASTNQPTFAGGAQPELFMTVHNPTAADCEIDLEKDVLRFEIYNLATNARIWSDVDCNPAVEDGTSVFPAGEDRYFQATWSRTNSAPGQCDNRAPVKAGAYFLHTVIGGNPSPAVTFNLT